MNMLDRYLKISDSLMKTLIKETISGKLKWEVISGSDLNSKICPGYNLFVEDTQYSQLLYFYTEQHPLGYDPKFPHKYYIKFKAIKKNTYPHELEDPTNYISYARYGNIRVEGEEGSREIYFDPFSERFRSFEELISLFDLYNIAVKMAVIKG